MGLVWWVVFGLGCGLRAALKPAVEETVVLVPSREVLPGLVAAI